MKLPLLVAIVAGGTIAQVGASPLRVVVVTNTHQELPAVNNFRFGHALADSHVAKIHTPPPINLVHPPGGRPPCGKRIKDKAIQISNAFRHALGLPLIETTPPHPGDNIHVHGGMVHILPFSPKSSGFNKPTHFESAPNHMHHIQEQPNWRAYHKIKHHHAHFHQWGSTFLMRIHNALMALGPWEGRAVAFVLGCGIGVLLRMFWVLTVVAYRTIRGEREDEYTQIAVVEEYADAEDIAVPPPTYTISDEKEQIKVKDAPEN